MKTLKQLGLIALVCYSASAMAMNQKIVQALNKQQQAQIAAQQKNDTSLPATINNTIDMYSLFGLNANATDADIYNALPKILTKYSDLKHKLNDLAHDINNELQGNNPHIFNDEEQTLYAQKIKPIDEATWKLAKFVFEWEQETPKGAVIMGNNGLVGRAKKYAQDKNLPNVEAIMSKYRTEF